METKKLRSHCLALSPVFKLVFSLAVSLVFILIFGLIFGPVFDLVAPGHGPVIGLLAGASTTLIVGSVFILIAGLVFGLVVDLRLALVKTKVRNWPLVR